MKRNMILLLSLFLAFAMLLTACGGAGGKTKLLTVCVGPDPDTIDPALNSAVDGGTLINHAFEGLTTLDKDGRPIAGQARDWDVSDDGRIYTFHLRDGLKWSDGQPVKAGDFVYSWNRAVDPETAADYEYIFDIIEGYVYDDPATEDVDEHEQTKLNISAPDDKTFVVVLKNPVPYFLELCAFPAYMPVRQDIVEKYGEAWAVDQKTYIGNGPYKMAEWVPGSHIIYEKNKNYWNYAKLGPDKIKFVLMEDDVAILNAFKNEEILFADNMPNDEIDAWRDKPEFNLQGQLGTYYVSFNVKKAPLDNPLVRRALILAVDRQFIVDNIGKAGQVPAGAFVSLGLSDADPTKQFREVGGDYYDPTGAAYEANLAEAKRLLAEAGYPDGKGLPTIEYIYNEGTGHQAIGEALQDMWKKIGVNITLVSQEWNTFLNTRKNGEYYIARNGWLSDYNDPVSMLDMWITGSGNNDAQWSNVKYDELIARIKTTTDPAERYTLMHQAEDIIFEESMLCPIYYYVDIFLLNQKLEGFWSTPLGFKYFMYTNV
jgi:oligopeptide transport system substrate-binding protein